jgi:hypothetical protein
MGAKALNEAFRNMGYCQEYTSPSFYEGKVFAISVQCVKAALCNSTLVIELCVEECKWTPPSIGVLQSGSYFIKTVLPFVRPGIDW